MSRIVVYVRNDVRYNKDLENKEVALCWLDIVMKEKKKLMCDFVYRVFKLSGLNNSGSLEEQRKRWECVMTSWEKTGSNDQIGMGDINLDFKQWYTDKGQNRQNNEHCQ